MKRFFSKKVFRRYEFDEDDVEADEEYVELNTDVDHGPSSKVVVRPFTMEEFSDVKSVIESLREGYTICLINIKPLREKDMIELKRAINKIKKTCEAVDGDIAGFGEDYIVVVPSFAQIHKGASIGPDYDDS